MLRLPMGTQFPEHQWHLQIPALTLADAILNSWGHDPLRFAPKGESMRKLTSPLKRQTELTSEKNAMA